MRGVEADLQGGESSRKNGYVWYVLSGHIGMASVIVGWSGCLEYMAGAWNFGGRRAMLGTAVVLSLVWLVALVVQGGILLGGGLRRHGRSRRVACAAMTLMMIASAIAVFRWRVLPDEAYLSGFRRWAAANVKVVAIRKWHAGLPAASGTSVPASTWPACVRAIRPDAVERLSAQGVVLKWGTRSNEGRNVFIGAAANSSPSEDSREYWEWFGPGAFVGLSSQRP